MELLLFCCLVKYYNYEYGYLLYLSLLYDGHLQEMMAGIRGKVTAMVSHLQSLTPYAMRGKMTPPNVHERLSTTPTNFLLPISTHSTSEKDNYACKKTEGR